MLDMRGNCWVSLLNSQECLLTNSPSISVWLWKEIMFYVVPDPILWVTMPDHCKRINFIPVRLWGCLVSITGNQFYVKPNGHLILTASTRWRQRKNHTERQHGWLCVCFFSLYLPSSCSSGQRDMQQTLTRPNWSSSKTNVPRKKIRVWNTLP